MEKITIMSKVRVRFAPSPTGNLHIGSVRTALFNYLFARRNKGTFILRIEDTDRLRSDSQYERSILDGLQWLGMDWDEGPVKNGNHGPYRQSERFKNYQSISNQLLKQGKAYYCFCTPDELEEKRQLQKSQKIPPRYDGTCAQLSPEEVQERLDGSAEYSIRFRVPHELVRFHDLVRGDLEFDSKLLGDMVIMKSDGSPTFNFACAVDDAAMEITHVIRGEDHISNTPKQILIARSIGASPPDFAHLPMILGKDRSKLSKRHGATNVMEYKKSGYLPQSLVNFLALLGWSHPEEKEILSLEDLTSAFSLERVGKSGSIFDTGKLDWLNHHYIQQLPEDEYFSLAGEFLPAQIAAEYNEQEKKKILKLVRDSINTFADIPAVTDYFYQPRELNSQAREFIEDLPFLQFCKTILEQVQKTTFNSISELFTVLQQAGKDSGLKGKQLYMSLRIAVTGSTEGVELQPLLEIMGIERILERVRKTVHRLEN